MTDGIRLGNHSKKIGSGATPRGGKEAYLEHGPFSLIRSQNIYNDGFRWDGLAYISDEQANQLRNVEVLEHDVLVNITGDSVARACQVDPRVLPARVNQHVAIIRPDFAVIDPTFLRYWLVDRRTQDFLLGLAAAGATRNALTKVMLEDLHLPQFDISDQREIGKALSTLDDKIELNRRMNETLEALAQAIFKDWFVDFGPVRRKLEGVTDPVAILGGLIPDPTRAQKTATHFPATFGDDGLPEGWSEVPLVGLCEINPKEPMTKGSLAYYNDMASLPTQGPTADAPVQREFGSGMRFRNGDALLARITPCLENGKAAFVDFLPPEQAGWGSTEFIVLRSRQGIPAPLSYLVVRHPAFKDHAIRSMTGTSGRQRAQEQSVGQYLISKATEAVYRSFGQLIEPLFEKISANAKENRTLAETRDYLLPKLMSGEVRVRDAEKMVEDHHVVTSQEVKSGVMVFGADLFGAPMLSPDQEFERDAVMVASVVKSFQRGREVVGNVRMQKGCYFTRRRAGLSISSFDKKAAGPYDATLNHEGGKQEAMAKGWIMEGTSAGGGKVFDGSVPGAKAREAEALVNQYGLSEAIGWVTKHLATKTRDELECLATVDFAMQTLRTKGHTPTLQLVKADIAGDAEWKPKLSKPHFSDSAIQKAMADLDTWLNEAKS